MDIATAEEKKKETHKKRLYDIESKWFSDTKTAKERRQDPEKTEERGKEEKGGRGRKCFNRKGKQRGKYFVIIV